MKRHDPAFKKAVELLPARIEDVKLISVEVNDPDQDPFVAHMPMVVPDDIPAALKDQFRKINAEHLARIRRQDAERDRRPCAERRLPFLAGA